MKIYLIEMSIGTYEPITTIIKAFKSEEKAKEFAKNCNEEYKKAFAHNQNLYRELIFPQINREDLKIKEKWEKYQRDFGKVMKDFTKKAWKNEFDTNYQYNHTNFNQEIYYDIYETELEDE